MGTVCGGCRLRGINCSRLIELNHASLFCFLPKDLFRGHWKINRVVSELVTFRGAELVIIPMRLPGFDKFIFQVKAAPQSHQSASEDQPSRSNTLSWSDKDPSLRIPSFHELNQSFDSNSSLFSWC